MSELLKREGVSVDVENDMVVFRVAANVSRFSYAQAFDIAQRLRLCAGVAARNAGVSREERSELKRQESPEHLVADVRLGDTASIKWDAWIQGELVAFQFGGTIAKWEAPAAMTIASWFREGGRQAKHNAGDQFKTLRLAGILTDANLNASLPK